MVEGKGQRRETWRKGKKTTVDPQHLGREGTGNRERGGVSGKKGEAVASKTWIRGGIKFSGSIIQNTRPKGGGGNLKVIKKKRQCQGGRGKTQVGAENKSKQREPGDLPVKKKKVMWRTPNQEKKRIKRIRLGVVGSLTRGGKSFGGGKGKNKGGGSVKKHGGRGETGERGIGLFCTN